MFAFATQADRLLGIVSGLCLLAWVASWFFKTRKSAPKERRRVRLLFLGVIAISALVLAWVLMHR